MANWLQMAEKWWKSAPVTFLTGIIALFATLLRLLPQAFPDLPWWIPNVTAIFLIGSLAACVSSILWYAFASPSRRYEAIYKENARSFGIGYRELIAVCAISEDGAAEVTYTATVEAFSEIQQVEFYLQIPERIDKATTSRLAQPISCQLRNKQKNQYRNDATRNSDEAIHNAKTRDNFDEATQTWTSVVPINNSLREGESIVCELRGRIPPGVYTLDKPCRKNTPYEYFGWNVVVPTLKLILEVHFPQNFEPVAPTADVYYASPAPPNAPPTRRNQQQYEHLKKPSHYGAGHPLRLVVDGPSHGLIYVLRWDSVRS